MMESLRPEEENIIEDIGNHFTLSKELNHTAIKDIRNLFRQKKKLKRLKVEYLETLRAFLSMKKKKKIFINL